jgi:hypothetical protein
MRTFLRSYRGRHLQRLLCRVGLHQWSEWQYVVSVPPQVRPASFWWYDTKIRWCFNCPSYQRTDGPKAMETQHYHDEER